MKVVCVNKHHLDNLTIGKIYEVTKEHYKMFDDDILENTYIQYIIDDTGVEIIYGSINNQDLIPLDEWRKEQLKKIGL